MIVFEADRVRRLVGRAERGELLPELFEELARRQEVAAGWIRGLGAFEWVELCEYDQSEQKYRPARRVDAPCEILSLEGNLSHKEGEPFAHLHATVSRETPDGVEVIGGHLVAGKVFACEFSVECYEDVSLDRAVDDATGLALWVGENEGDEEPDPTEPDDADRAGGPSWADVAAASRAPAPEPAPAPRPRKSRQRSGPGASRGPEPPAPAPLPPRRRTTEEEFLQERIPEKGDYIEHRQFGTCRVDGEDAEGGLRIKLPTGVRKVIRLDFLEVGAPRHEEGRRIFPVGPRRRG